MINNFEKYTHELTDMEIKIIVPAIIRGLENKIGKKKAITNKQMIQGLKNISNIITTAPRIRKMIHHIRITGLIERLIATSKGYYISNNPEELILYIESLIQRSESINLIAKQLDYQTKLMVQNTI